jgi:hypothetical protein
MKRIEEWNFQQQSVLKIQGVFRAALRARKKDGNIRLLQCSFRMLIAKVQFMKARRLASLLQGTLVQELALVYIIFTTFSITFYKGASGTTIGEVFIMIGTVFVCMISLMTLAWFSLKLLFRNKPKQRVMGLFGCTHKTLTVVVPLIQTLYRNDPNIGIYILPILIWHPM